MEELKEKWNSLMKSFAIEDSQDTFDKLCKAYNEPHRHYHTVSHIRAMLTHFEKVKDGMDHCNEVECAIWFHDAIYKPFSSSNELDSAEWAKGFLLDNNCKSEVIDRIYALIMVTQHNGEPRDRDQEYMLDIDLTILGTPDSVYEEFEKNVRKEYKWVPAIIYNKKRREILHSFLNRNTIYFSEYFNNRFEDQARKNITKAIDQLK